MATVIDSMSASASVASVGPPQTYSAFSTRDTTAAAVWNSGISKGRCAAVEFSHEGACQARVDHPPCPSRGVAQLAYRAWSFSHWCPVMVPGTHYDLTHGSLIFAEGLCAQNSKEGSRGHGGVASGSGLL